MTKSPKAKKNITERNLTIKSKDKKINTAVKVKFPE
jgi:hypothetical protein